MEVKEIKLTNKQKEALTVSDEVARNFQQSYAPKEKVDTFDWDSYFMGFLTASILFAILLEYLK